MRRQSRMDRAMQRYRKIKSLHRDSARQRGFSLIEMLIVITLFMVVAGMTFMAFQSALKDSPANSVFEDVMMRLRGARPPAVAARKQYIVCFGVAGRAG